MKNNPFSLSFGKKPLEYIDRYNETEKIITVFTDENPATNAYMIAGIRGSGKTVFLSNIKKYFDSNNDWFVLNLNIDTDMISYAVSQLRKNSLFATTSDIGLSVGSIGISMSTKDDENENSIILKNIIENIKKKNKRILFVVDEVVNNKNMRAFAGFFRICMMDSDPVFLLMAGLYDNISNLQNAETLTFLHRTPKIFLQPLSIKGITSRYIHIFGSSLKEAKEMAEFTKGYPFAFQILGYLKWEKERKLNDIIPDFDDLLFSLVYEKVWSELSALDKSVVKTIAKGSDKVSDIREELDFSPQKLNVYRKRLIDRGVVKGEDRGILSLALPRFEEYVKLYCE